MARFDSNGRQVPVHELCLKLEFPKPEGFSISDLTALARAEMRAVRESRYVESLAEANDFDVDDEPREWFERLCDED